MLAVVVQVHVHLAGIRVAECAHLQVFCGEVSASQHSLSIFWAGASVHGENDFAHIA